MAATNDEAANAPVDDNIDSQIAELEAEIARNAAELDRQKARAALAAKQAVVRQQRAELEALRAGAPAATPVAVSTVVPGTDVPLPPPTPEPFIACMPALGSTPSDLVARALLEKSLDKDHPWRSSWRQWQIVHSTAKKKSSSDNLRKLLLQRTNQRTITPEVLLELTIPVFGDEADAATWRVHCLELHQLPAMKLLHYNFWVATKLGFDFLSQWGDYLPSLPYPLFPPTDDFEEFNTQLLNSCCTMQIAGGGAPKRVAIASAEADKMFGGNTVSGGWAPLSIQQDQSGAYVVDAQPLVDYVDRRCAENNGNNSGNGNGGGGRRRGNNNSNNNNNGGNRNNNGGGGGGGNNGNNNRGGDSGGGRNQRGGAAAAAPPPATSGQRGRGRGQLRGGEADPDPSPGFQ